MGTILAIVLVFAYALDSEPSVEALHYCSTAFCSTKNATIIYVLKNQDVSMKSFFKKYLVENDFLTLYNFIDGFILTLAMYLNESLETINLLVNKKLPTPKSAVPKYLVSEFRAAPSCSQCRFEQFVSNRVVLFSESICPICSTVSAS